MKIGIVGLPNVGKSTLFKALTKKQIDIANYPFCTIEPNTGIVKVPDDRLKALAEFSHSEKIIPAIIEFVDIAGLVKGASQGEGLGNKFLSHIREVDAVAHVVRAFEDDDIIHVSGVSNPQDDIAVIHLELILSDMAVVEKRIAGLQQQLRTGQQKGLTEILATLEKCKATLESEKLLNQAGLSDEELAHIKDIQLLTIKPFLFVCNVKEGEEPLPSLVSYIKEAFPGFPIVPLCAKNESELAELSDEELSELGLTRTGIDRLIQEAYATVGLMTYFTTGPQETRAWTIHFNTKAPQAAGEIHSDFEKNFIRAEVINWQDLINAGSEVAAKEKGLIRIEGKEYVVADGDVMVIRHGA